MTDLTALKKDYLQSASSLEKRLTDLSDSFYRAPEIGLEEFKTSSAMQDLLRGFGFAVEMNVPSMPTAFKAVFGSGRPAVALMAEMDALPGIGHGCGHNMAGTASVGAGAALAISLKDVLKPGKGSVVVLGCPAEELGKGKIALIEAGAFNGIDAAMMVHGSSKRIVAKQFLGLIRLNFTFFGRASHASAYPEQGINALDALIQTFNSINALRQQLRSDVRVHGIITDGGKAPNIIPERAAASFYVRASDFKELLSVKTRVVNCAEGAAKAAGCALETIESPDKNAPMKINNAFIGLYREALAFLGLEEDVTPQDRNVGSSDVGNVSQVVPAIHPHVPIKPGINIHTREFADSTAEEEGHRALMEGVAALGLTAIELLFKPESLEKVVKDFKAL